MLTAVNEQPILSTLRNKDLIYSELLDEIKTAHSLLSEVKSLSSELQETINTLKDKAESQYLNFEHLPDFVDIKILKEYLKVGTNRIYELTNSSGFPKPVQYANGKKVFAKSDIKEWLERPKGKVLKKIK